MPVPPRAPLRLPRTHPPTRPASLTHPQQNNLTGLRPVTALDTSSLKIWAKKNPAEAGLKGLGGLLYFGFGFGLAGGKARVIERVN